MWGFGKGVSEKPLQKSAEQLEKEARAKNDRLLERLAIDTEITAAVLDTPQNIDLHDEILHVRKQLESATDDDERQKLQAQRTVLREYQKAIQPPESVSSVSLDSLQNVPDRLAEPWKEKMYPDILTADAMKVRRYETPEEPKPSKKEEAPSEPAVLMQRHIGTAVNIKRLAPPEFAEGQSDIGQAAK